MSKRTYKYYDFVMAAFVVVLLCSNLIGPGKLSYIHLFGFKIEFEAGNLFFAFSYIFGDILTEVYGYARSRRVIWAGFSACAFAGIMTYIVVNIPSTMLDEYQIKLQSSLEVVFGNTFRVILGSLVAFWAGEFVNSFVMAKMKILTQGKYLWTRTIGSTFVGQIVDSTLFYTVAFYGVWQEGYLLRIIAFAILTKIVWEAMMTPFTYLIVNALKKAENEDYFDTDTNFTPFSVRT